MAEDKKTKVVEPIYKGSMDVVPDRASMLGGFQRLVSTIERIAKEKKLKPNRATLKIELYSDG